MGAVLLAVFLLVEELDAIGLKLGYIAGLAVFFVGAGSILTLDKDEAPLADEAATVNCATCLPLLVVRSTGSLPRRPMIMVNWYIVAPRRGCQLRGKGQLLTYTCGSL